MKKPLLLCLSAGVSGVLMAAIAWQTSLSSRLAAQEQRPLPAPAMTRRLPVDRTSAEVQAYPRGGQPIFNEEGYTPDERVNIAV